MQPQKAADHPKEGDWPDEHAFDPCCVIRQTSRNGRRIMNSTAQHMKNHDGKSSGNTQNIQIAYALHSKLSPLEFSSVSIVSGASIAVKKDAKRIFLRGAGKIQIVYLLF
jgi:hypothetical protein